MAYRPDLFTGGAWAEFLSAEAEVSGLRDTRWTTVQKISEGDLLLCYLTGVSRFVGVLEVTGKPFRDEKRIWQDQVFPCRLPVKPVVALQPHFGVPVCELPAGLGITCWKPLQRLAAHSGPRSPG